MHYFEYAEKDSTLYSRSGSQNTVIDEILEDIKRLGRLPVVTFTAGGIATPADAALVMQLGAEAVFVGSGIFKSENPEPRAKAIVEATTNFNSPEILAKVSRGLGGPMTGIGMDEIAIKLEERGW